MYIGYFLIIKDKRILNHATSDFNEYKQNSVINPSDNGAQKISKDLLNIDLYLYIKHYYPCTKMKSI